MNLGKFLQTPCLRTASSHALQSSQRRSAATEFDQGQLAGLTLAGQRRNHLTPQPALLSTCGNTSTKSITRLSSIPHRAVIFKQLTEDIKSHVPR